MLVCHCTPFFALLNGFVKGSDGLVNKGKVAFCIVPIGQISLAIRESFVRGVLVQLSKGRLPKKSI
jgi:hypothetical protein